MFPKHKAELESWALVEIAAQSQGWIDALEGGALVDGRNAVAVIHIIPTLYEALGVPDGPSRIEELRQRAIQLLIKDRYYALALDVLSGLAHPQPKLEALCHEALGNLRSAAERFRLADDNLKAALKVLSKHTRLCEYAQRRSRDGRSPRRRIARMARQGASPRRRAAGEVHPDGHGP